MLKKGLTHKEADLLLRDVLRGVYLTPSMRHRLVSYVLELRTASLEFVKCIDAISESVESKSVPMYRRVVRAELGDTEGLLTFETLREEFSIEKMSEKEEW